MGMSYVTTVIAQAAGATAEIVAAVAGKSIKVHAYSVSSDTVATIAEFEGASGLSLSGNIRLADETTVLAPFATEGYFQTPGGTALNLQTTTGAVSGYVRWSLA